jgi:hypothetical protein
MAHQPILLVPSSPDSTFLIYHALDGRRIDDDLLDRCAKLFSRNYGIWGHTPTAVTGLKPDLSFSCIIPTRLTRIQVPGSR